VMELSCPVCGSTDAPKYDGSNWCESCVLVVLEEQKELDVPVQEREII
jgi:uncharacterized Zn finger protein (UPF0148 family)